MVIVVDSSAVAALLAGGDYESSWVEDSLRDQSLAAPHVLRVEVAGILRRAELAGLLTSDAAATAHADLIELPVKLYPYEPFAGRIWALRSAITAHDAWYISVAEALDAPLMTLDVRLAGSSGPRCTFTTPYSH